MTPRLVGLPHRLRILSNTRRTVGFWETLRLASRRALARPPRDRFDEQYGVDTREELDPSEAQLPNGLQDRAEKYAPTHPRLLRHIFENLDVDYPSTTFVDIGCGKGRGVLVAMGFPFRKVVGVELSPVTSAIARKNLEIFLARGDAKCRDVEILNQNALEFPLPDSNVAFYLFHPFHSEVLERFVDHVSEGLRRSAEPRSVVLAYSMLLPTSANVLAARPDLRMTRDCETLSGVYSWSLWEFMPGG